MRHRTLIQWPLVITSRQLDNCFVFVICPGGQRYMNNHAQTTDGLGMQGGPSATGPGSRKPLRLAVLVIGAIVLLAAGLGVGATTSISAQKQLTTARGELSS